MKILRLELFGFKSFREKTIVSFNQPITSIVGSNGCGKSNIVDALYWVMGDMSPKHLRGNSMKDVIFSGSRDHVAMDMAEVTLVLEHDAENDPPLPPQFEQMKEMQISRRYYRSGDSEYFINKTNCRLRDIQEFFMDTGVGAKAYSIIEQGAITRMVQQKPEDRRAVIEEVAGIMKFKARRAETERKLEHTHTNLQRIDDILKDLQKSLNLLRRQADRAEKYSDFTKELKDLELRISGQQWVDHKESQSKKSEIRTAILEQLAEYERDLEENRKSTVQHREELVGLEALLNEKRVAHRNAELKLKDLESELSNLGTKKESFDQRINDAHLQKEQLEERDQILDTQIRELESELDTWVLQATEFKDKLEECKTALNEKKEHNESIRTEVDELRKQYHGTEVEQTKLTEQIQNLQNSHRELRNKQERLEIQINEVQSETQIHEAERETTAVFLEEAFSKRSDLEAQKQDLDLKLADHERSREELQGQRNELRDELSHVKIRREHLESLDRNLEGVDAATRSIALRLRELGIEKALVADRVNAPELLEKAVEAVLGNNLQRAFVKDLSQVRELRNHLKNHTEEDARRGRSRIWVDDIFSAHDASQNSLENFWIEAPLTVSSTGPNEIPGPDGLLASPTAESYTEAPQKRLLVDILLEDDDVLGPLSKLVSEDIVQDYAWTKTLEQVWVVKDVFAFEKIAKLCDYKLPIDLVSLQGDFLTRDGLIDLAAIEESQDASSHSMVHRRNEISKLAQEQGFLEGRLGRVEAELNIAEENVESSRMSIKSLTAQLVELNPDLEKHSEFLRQVEAQIARLHEKSTLLNTNLVDARTTSLDVSGRTEECAALLSECETRRTAVGDQLSQKEAELREATASLKAVEDAKDHSEKRYQEINQQLQEHRNQLAGHKQERRLSETRHEQLNLEITRLQQGIEDVEVDLTAKLEVLHIEKSGLEVFAQAENEQNALVDTCKAKVDKTQAKVEQLITDTQKMHSDVKDLEQQSAVHAVELKNLEDRITEKYEVKFSELEESKIQEILAPDDLEEMLSIEASKDRLDQLRKRIDGLGKINMVAKEEFDEKRQRYEYLFIQKKDIEDAVAQLREAIEKIDRESRERFEQSFNDVNEAFQKTFPILFGGGTASLRLTDPENLLESGVEIVAQPPGKKLQSVTLLSGGEKALTAVSLIFGIFSIKPSPFCVLDEVDAPLDDTNVGRFNTQVRNMSETSQIIMITHHKKTMESSDALFGVTMEKPGVSKIASARLGRI